MINLDVWLEGTLRELGLVFGAQCHRVDASYRALPFPALLVSLRLACHRQVAHRLAARRSAARVRRAAGSDYWLRGRRISHGVPPPLDSRRQNHDVRGPVVYQRALRLYRSE